MKKQRKVKFGVADKIEPQQPLKYASSERIFSIASYKMGIELGELGIPSVSP